MISRLLEFLATRLRPDASVARIGCPEGVLSDAPVDNTLLRAPIHFSVWAGA